MQSPIQKVKSIDESKVLLTLGKGKHGETSTIIPEGSTIISSPPRSPSTTGQTDFMPRLYLYPDNPYFGREIIKDVKNIIRIGRASNKEEDRDNVDLGFPTRVVSIEMNKKKKKIKYY